MIKTKVITLVESVEIMKKIANEELPIKVSFKLMRLMKAIDVELTNYRECLQKIFDKYAVDNDGKKTIPSDMLPEADAEARKIQDVEVEINAEKITIDEIADCKLSPADLLTIEDLIVC